MVRGIQNETQLRTLLKCSSCGNSSYFVEIMAYESHIVNTNRDYVRLAAAEVDRYECLECGAIVSSFGLTNDQ